MNLSKQTCRSFAVAGIVCAGISLIVGGSLLALVGFVLGVLSNMGSRRLLAAAPNDADAQGIYKLSRVAVVVCCAAFVLNMLAALFLLPAMLDQLESMGIDTSSLLGTTGTETATGTGTDSGSSGIF